MYCSNTDWRSHIHSQQRCKVNAGKEEMEVDGWRTDISECTLPESPTEIKSPYLSLYTVYIQYNGKRGGGGVRQRWMEAEMESERTGSSKRMREAR